jgi:putative transposase
MAKHTRINLPTEHRQHLEKLTRTGTSKARVITRAKILLLADTNQNQKQTRKDIAQLTQTSVPTVSRICNRYAVEGLHAALEEKPRPGAIPKITGEIEAKIMLLACSEPPKGAARWTLSLLKNQVVAEGLLSSVGRTTLGDRLKKMKLNPGRSNATAFRKRTRTS